MADREELSPLKVVEGWGFTHCKPANPHFLNAENTMVVFIMDIHNQENREDESIMRNRLPQKYHCLLHEDSSQVKPISLTEKNIRLIGIKKNFQ